MNETSTLRHSIAIFGIAAVVLLVVNIRLVQTNHRLQTRAEAAEQSLQQDLSVRPGTLAKPIHGYDLGRRRTTVSFEHQPQQTLLLVFSPHCPACEEMWPLWRNIASAVDRRVWRIVAVDSTQLVDDQYVADKKIRDIELVASPDAESVADFPFRLTPQMIVISRLGIVQSVWTGAPQKVGEQGFDELARALGLSKSLILQTTGP